MTALAWVLVRQLRSRWRSWAVLAVLVGLAGAVVLTATAGARRTDSAYGRFLDSIHAADVLVSPNNTGFGGYYGALAKLPGAETVAPVIGIQALPFRPGPKLVEAQVYAPADRRYGNVIERPRVVSGRLPDPARVHEVALDLKAASQLHVGVGGTIMLAATLSSASPGQQPQGLRVFRQRVVGVFMTRDNPVPINALAQLPIVYATHAFYAELGPPYRGFDGAYVRLRPGASAFQFGRQAEALAKKYPATGGGVFVANLSDQAAQIERAIRPEAIALGLFALVVALTGLVIIAQAVLRQLRASEHRPRHPAGARTHPPAAVVDQPDAGGGRGRGGCRARRRPQRARLSDHAPRRGAPRGAQSRHRRRCRRARPWLRRHRRAACRSRRVAVMAAEQGDPDHQGQPSQRAIGAGGWPGSRGARRR